MITTSREPRILILPASYGADGRVIGGGERYAYEYARALANLTPVTLALFGGRPESQEEGPLRVRTLPGNVTRPFFWARRTTRAELLEHDVFHAMVFPTPATDYLLLLGAWARKPVVLTDVGGGGRCLSGFLRRWGRAWDLNRRADGLALLSPYSARFFAHWSQPRAILLGGVRQAFEPQPSRPEGFALFVGRLLPHKGVLPLIEAMPPDVPLKIVGESYDPAYDAALRRAAKHRQVEFAGRVTDQELDDLYARASVVVQPSLPLPGEDKSELLGLAVIEAMAREKPVVVTAAGSLPDLVVPGVTGFRSPVASEPATSSHPGGTIPTPPIPGPS